MGWQAPSIAPPLVRPCLLSPFLPTPHWMLWGHPGKSCSSGRWAWTLTAPYAPSSYWLSPSRPTGPEAPDTDDPAGRRPEADREAASGLGPGPAEPGKSTGGPGGPHPKPQGGWVSEDSGIRNSPVLGVHELRMKQVWEQSQGPKAEEGSGRSRAQDKLVPVLAPPLNSCVIWGSHFTSLRLGFLNTENRHDDTQLIWRKCTKAREGSGRAGPTVKALCPALGRRSGEGPESSKDASLVRLQCVNTVTRNSSSGRRSARRPSHTWGCSWFCLSQLVSSQIYPLGLVFKFLSLVLTHCRAACCPLHLVP